VALLLRRNGIVRVRPLLGGIDAWRERKYPTELRAGVTKAFGAESAKEGTPPTSINTS